MLPGLVQGDAKFTAFQAELATVVVGARARGLKVSRSFAEGCCCPLGAHPESVSLYPSSMQAAREGWASVEQQSLSFFIRGYHLDEGIPASPYADLGRAYAEQFP